MRSMGASSLLSVAVAGLTASLTSVELAQSMAREAGDEDLEEVSQRLVGELQLVAARMGRMVRESTSLADHPFVPRTTSPYCARCPRRAAYHPGPT